MNDLETKLTSSVSAQARSRFREAFPILKRSLNGSPLVYFDNAASTQKPSVVSEAITHYYTHQHSNVHRGVHTLSQEATTLFEEAREKVRAFLNAAYSREIIFTRGTTEGINLVAYSWGNTFLQPGDEVVLTEMEHHSNIVPWQLVCETTGAKIRVARVTDEGALDLVHLKSLLNERTKLVSVVHVSNALGTINPVKEIVQWAHEVGALVLIDGAQAAPHMAPDVRDLDCDFYVFSGHKIYGPTGTGILYGREELLEKMPPWQGGGEMIKEVRFSGTTFNELPFKFEAGTPHISGHIALGVALDFVQDFGYDFIQACENDLLNYAIGELQQIEDLQFVGTQLPRASVVSFNVKGLHPYDVGTLLDQMGIAVRTGHHCTQPLMERYNIPGTVRASLSAYNTREEIDRFISALNKSIKMLK